jgi:hypothetical protein
MWQTGAGSKDGQEGRQMWGIGAIIGVSANPLGVSSPDLISAKGFSPTWGV